MTTYWISVQRAVGSYGARYRVDVFPRPSGIAPPSSETIDGETYAWLRDNVRAAIHGGDVIVAPGWEGGFYVHLTEHVY